MELKVKSQVCARFKLVVRKAADDSISKETDWFDNIVLDSGLARMSVGTWIDRCCVGAGNSTPVATQTTLDSFLASTTTTTSSTGSNQTSTAPYYSYIRKIWRFAQGVATGNVSEVGLGWANNTLWNRALIKDGSGNPTTITILSDEYLDVTSEVRVYLGGATGSFNLLDKLGAILSTHEYTVLPFLTYAPDSFTFPRVALGDLNTSSFYIYDGVMNGVTIYPSGAMSYKAGKKSETYPTTTSVRATWELGLTSANQTHKSFGMGISIISAANPTGYKLQINPAITKNNTQIMTYTFELSWDRYTP